MTSKSKFKRDLLSAYCVLDTIVGIRDMSENKTNRNVPTHCGSYMLMIGAGPGRAEGIQ